MPDQPPVEPYGLTWNKVFKGRLY